VPWVRDGAAPETIRPRYRENRGVLKESREKLPIERGAPFTLRFSPKSCQALGCSSDSAQRNCSKREEFRAARVRPSNLLIRKAKSLKDRGKPRT
jgi:hypothetical protein